METFKEPIHYQNERLCMKVWQFTSSSPPRPFGQQWHYHKEVEFILVQEGRLGIRTPDNSYSLTPGDVLLIGSSQLHISNKPEDGALVYIVLHVDLQPYFDPAMMMYYRHFSEMVRPLEDLNYIFLENERAKQEVGRIIVDVHSEMMDKTKGYEIAMSMHIKHLLLALLRYDRRELLQPFEFVDAAVMRPILDYVEAHLVEKIEMEEVSRIAGMSYTYFSKYFKKCVGLSFTDYVNRQRIRKAGQLLATKTDIITEVAAGVGFENMAHFYELFKRYNGCTPKEYARKLLREG
ncbi:helix-turn-helix domain-containing protein [Paenibacillus sp. GCM10023248]|uniref:helix-turn-helix domain-containing protein n=1 Tax=Bacillales TaxID=1385 RepID=UPI0023783379|nr:MULTISPECIES: AraC family transcriptional regulator [Bacillales]MDD9267317.1 AraC family transcriptional regulator [Paenibacillus sp. MAHUQ-63]MDR6884818.1 AraC-like DNA-binding protein/mannose-6-phosphate isomerase-like protein (cupin superfamily) [Bacillus sp. 3255]